MKSKLFLFSMSLGATLLLFSFNTNEEHQGDPWIVPEKYRNMDNPIPANSDNLATGKSLYNKHCKSCHGNDGWGDGSKAAQLDTPCGDFSLQEFQSQSDGAIFYKTIKGRDDMPGFEKKIPYAEDVWAIVHYIRTFEE